MRRSRDRGTNVPRCTCVTSQLTQLINVCIKDIRVTKVSARADLEVCGKPAFLSAYKSDRICDAVATEERMFRGALTIISQISCMQFSRYKSF